MYIYLYIYTYIYARTQILHNVAFNGPRAAVSFTDGFAGGHVTEGNLFFNFVRETSDHGLINSWDRQPYITRFFLFFYFFKKNCDHGLVNSWDRQPYITRFFSFFLFL